MGRAEVTRDALGDDYYCILIYDPVNDNYIPPDAITTNGYTGMVALAPGHVSTKNSRAFSLAGDASWSGTAEDITNYGVISINVFATVASATDGLVVEQSSDGTNWDHSDCFTIPANTGKVFSFQAAAKYFRLRYTNGITGGTQRIQTVLKPYYVKPSSHRIQDEITSEDDAELVKAVLTGEDPDGMFQNVKTTPDGDLTISDNSSGLSIAKGNVTGTSFIHKFGQAPDFDTVDNAVTIWDGADDADIDEMVYTYSSTAAIDSLSSTDDTDTQTIEVQGLDANYDLVTQTKALTGQTRVALDTSLIRVFRLKNVDSTNLGGHVYCFENDTTTLGVPDDTGLVRAMIHSENNQTLMAVFTIPNGFTGYMRDWYANTSGGSRDSNYVIRLKARPFGGVFQLKHISALADDGSSHIQHKYTEPEKFLAKTDIEMTAQMTLAAATAAAVGGGFDIVLVAD